MSNAPRTEAAVYFNGEIVAAAHAHLPIDDRAVLYGSGFFETFRTCGGRPHHWDVHRRRLEQACATAELALPKSFLALNEDRLREVIQTLLQQHGSSDAVFRYTVTAGGAAQSAQSDKTPPAEKSAVAEPSEFLVLRPLPAEISDEGICVRVLDVTRDNGEWLPRPKSLNFANVLLGNAELRRRKAGRFDEGLMLSREGAFLVETTRQNIAWIADGKLSYPDPALGAVAGTCLEWLLDLGVPNDPRRAPLDELFAADAIVVTNAVRGVTPVNLVYGRDDRPIRVGLDSHNHPIVASLRRQWTEAMEATAGS